MAKNQLGQTLKVAEGAIGLTNKLLESSMQKQGRSHHVSQGLLHGRTAVGFLRGSPRGQLPPLLSLLPLVPAQQGRRAQMFLHGLNQRRLSYTRLAMDQNNFGASAFLHYPLVTLDQRLLSL
jgi:hypothetical protein